MILQTFSLCFPLCPVVCAATKKLELSYPHGKRELLPKWCNRTQLAHIGWRMLSNPETRNNKFEFQKGKGFCGHSVHPPNQRTHLDQTGTPPNPVNQLYPGIKDAGENPKIPWADKGKGIDHIGSSNEARRLFKKPRVIVQKVKCVCRPKQKPMTQCDPVRLGTNADNKINSEHSEPDNVSFEELKEITLMADVETLSAASVISETNCNISPLSPVSEEPDKASNPRGECPPTPRLPLQTGLEIVLVQEPVYPISYNVTQEPMTYWYDWKVQWTILLLVG